MGNYRVGRGVQRDGEGGYSYVRKNLWRVESETGSWSLLHASLRPGEGVGYSTSTSRNQNALRAGHFSSKMVPVTVILPVLFLSNSLNAFWRFTLRGSRGL